MSRAASNTCVLPNSYGYYQDQQNENDCPDGLWDGQQAERQSQRIPNQS